MTTKHPSFAPVFCRWRFTRMHDGIQCYSSSCGATLSLDALGEPFAAAALDPRPRPWNLKDTPMPRCPLDKEPAAGLAMHIFYYGCLNDTGHYLFKPDDEIRHRGWPFPWGPEVDGGLYPKSEPNGVARLHHREGWTALSFSDNSIDSRPGSHSTFLIKGTLDFDAALACAREAFPNVFARFKFKIRQEPEKKGPA